MKKLVFSFVVLSFIQNSYSQSAWTLQEDTWYTQVNFTTIGPYSSVFLDGNDQINLPREVTDNTLQLYSEYGLDKKTTLSVILPIKFIESGREVFSNAGTSEGSVSALGNLTLGVRRNLLNKDFVLSTTLLIEANTSTFDKSTGIRTGYDAWSFSPSVGVGKGISNVFVQGNTGFDFRTNSYSHSFKANAEAGYKFFDLAWLIFHLDYIKSFKNGDVQLPIENLNTFLYVNDQEYSGYSLKAIVEISENIGVTGGFGGAFSANFLARKAAINFGAYLKLGGGS